MPKAAEEERIRKNTNNKDHKKKPTEPPSFVCR